MKYLQINASFQFSSKNVHETHAKQAQKFEFKQISFKTNEMKQNIELFGMKTHRTNHLLRLKWANSVIYLEIF